MPQKTIFIRDEDLGKWKSIEKKSEFIHNALNPKFGTLKELVDSGEAEVVELEMAGIPDLLTKKGKDIPGYIEEIVTDWKPCKHGADPKFCRFSKPGKPCK